MRPNAVLLLSVSARHAGGMAKTCRLPSAVLAEDAAPGKLSGSEDRACPTDHALCAFRSNADRTVGGAWVRAIHTCLVLGDLRSTTALSGVPPFAHRAGLHRQPIEHISGLVRRRIGMPTRTWVAAHFRECVQLFPNAAVARPGRFLERPFYGSGSTSCLSCGTSVKQSIESKQSIM